MTVRRTWAAVWAAAWLVLGAGLTINAVAAPAPSLRVVPTPVPTGSTVTVFGHNFCSAASCPAVQIDADGQHFATATVRPDGNFSVRVPIHLTPNQYHVRAQQLAPSGTLIATTGMTVLPAETRPSGPVSTTYPSTPSSPHPKASVTATGSPPALTASPAATPSSTPSAAPTPAATSPAAAHLTTTSSHHSAAALALGLLAGAAAAAIPLTLLLRQALRGGRV